MVAGVVRAGVGVVDHDDPEAVEHDPQHADEQRQREDGDDEPVGVVETVPSELRIDVERHAVTGEGEGDPQDQAEVLQIANRRKRHVGSPQK